jgi:hypothetical protein
VEVSSADESDSFKVSVSLDCNSTSEDGSRYEVVGFACRDAREGVASVERKALRCCCTIALFRRPQSRLEEVRKSRDVSRSLLLG